MKRDQVKPRKVIEYFKLKSRYVLPTNKNEKESSILSKGNQKIIFTIFI